MNGKESSTSSDSLGEPAVVVLPFEALGSTADSRYLADGIGQELINDLMQFPGFRVYTLPIDLEKDANPETVKPGSDLGVAYVVRGNVYADTATIRVAAQMFNAVTGRVLWTGSYDRPLTPEALIRVQSDLSGEIATILGQPYGVVNDDLKVRLAPAVSNMQSYVCVLRAYGYRRSFARAEFDPVLQCLEEAVRRDPDYSDAWAMLGWLYLDAGRYGFSRGGNAQEEYKKAVEASSQAVTLEPNNPLALKALAAVDYYIGRYDESERLTRQALKLNPYDPETLAQLGWRLAARGKFAEGIPTLERAIQRSVNPPGWYFHLIAIDLFLKGDYKQMLRTAERSAVDGSDFSQALLAIANGELGDVKATQAALEKMSASKPLARDFAAFLRLHGATDEIVNALTEGLQKARRVASKS
ncbi:MAG: tetratricopeptide repeat protein [Gammaproteobacteria bacterium]|nr:tetratricopeptide repeat protein [Gammaproteobacteria bacterium]